MDILKAVGKVGAAANQAASVAVQRRQLDAETRALADLRSQAFGLRAQIGEEMYKLWQERKLPPSSLDHLFQSVDRTTAAIDDQRAVVDGLMAQYVARQGGGSDAGDEVEIIDLALPPPPVPAAPTHRLGDSLGAALPGADQTPAGTPADACPTCGAAVPAGKRYCGFCGTRLG